MRRNNSGAKTLSDWAKEANIHRGTVYSRIRRGWSRDQAIWHPLVDHDETTRRRIAARWSASMASRNQVAAKEMLAKFQNPERFCKFKDCLWRLATWHQRDTGWCPRHEPQKQGNTPAIFVK